MRSFLRKNIYLLLTFLVSFAIFFRSLTVFYTNDDFFFLRISNAKSFPEFTNFFNIFHKTEGFAMYRPLTTQAFYFLADKFFNLNPLPLHIMAFITFFAVIYLVYKLSGELVTDKKIGLIAAFLYAVGAPHFGNLYYLAAFQELGMTFFVLLSCLGFVRKRYILSFIFFVLALMSLETAVVTPILIFLIYCFQRLSKAKTPDIKSFCLTLLPFAICLIAYLAVRFKIYGFASGDSYVWDFSLKKLPNTLGWYGAWSLNLPESLVDFVGPGLKLNPNLFLYWSGQIIPIFVLFALELIMTLYIFIKSGILKYRFQILFGLLWFVIALLPVAFLPLHKFAFYLTLPAIGVVFVLGYFLKVSKINNVGIGLFLAVWTIISILTVQFTVQTNWITQGEAVAKNVYNYVSANEKNLNGKTIEFYDTQADSNLPFSPTVTVKNTLSDNNFFEVYYGENIKAVYGNQQSTKNIVKIQSRKFLGY